MPFDPVPGILATTSTAGTGPFTSTGAVSGFRAGSVLANGTEVPVTRWDASWAFEEGTCTVSTTGGVTTWTWVRRTRTSNGVNSPVSWAPGGTQNVVVGLVGSMVLYWHNYLAELAANLPLARANLGLGTSAVLDVGTTANKVVQLNGLAQLPAVSGALLTNLPAGTPSVPSGSVMPFYQSATPATWTRHATLDDQVLRIVKSGSLVGVAGSLNGATWTITGLSVGATTLTTAQIPSHSHTVAASVSGTILAKIASGGIYTTPGAGSTVVPATDTDPVGGGGSHTHTLNSTGAWQPPCADCLLATKN